MKRKATILAALAIVLVLCMGIAPAWGYFTDTTMASGSLKIGVKPSTDIHETYGQGVKHVTISNDADATTAVFVRARVYSSLEYAAAGTGWSGPDAEGWYTYADAVAPGGTTAALDVTITFPKVETDEDGKIKDSEYGTNYNVVVVYESTPAQYDENGQPKPDWNLVLDTVVEERGN